MKTIDTDQLLGALNWRYATKQFDPARKIPADTWAALEEALVLSPSSYGLQPWKFFVVTDSAVRAALREHSWNQSQVTDCSHHVVFAIRRVVDAAFADKFIARIAAVRGVTAESLDFYRKMIFSDVIEGPRSKIVAEWATRQAYIALGNFMTSAAVIGVDTCPMEGIDPTKYDEILGLPEKGFQTVVACAAGYRADGDKYAALPKVRFEKSELIEHV
ncbi:MAG: NAD(P)H-dependent oxidoreductase [Terrimicrobiaceae bacterium]|nr:NAD(P)H-dependent oxidoreductase [Terrimicrobiaceae bacterium]